MVGAGGFAKTLTAYIIYFAATRVNLENPLLRIPVLAAASLLDSAIYVFWHRVLGNPPAVPLMQTMSYKLIATTVVGTLALYMLDALVAETSSQRRQFATRRRVARRSTGPLKKEMNHERPCRFCESLATRKYKEKALGKYLKSMKFEDTSQNLRARLRFIQVLVIADARPALHSTLRATGCQG